VTRTHRRATGRSASQHSGVAKATWLELTIHASRRANVGYTLSADASERLLRGHLRALLERPVVLADQRPTRGGSARCGTSEANVRRRGVRQARNHSACASASSTGSISARGNRATIAANGRRSGSQSRQTTARLLHRS